MCWVVGPMLVNTLLHWPWTLWNATILPQVVGHSYQNYRQADVRLQLLCFNQWRSKEWYFTACRSSKLTVAGDIQQGVKLASANQHVCLWVCWGVCMGESNIHKINDCKLYFRGNICTCLQLDYLIGEIKKKIIDGSEILDTRVKMLWLTKSQTFM